MWFLWLLLLAQVGPPLPVTIPNLACDTIRAQSMDEPSCTAMCLEQGWELSSCGYCCVDGDDLEVEVVKR